jgi:hypothetical protein
MHAKLRVVLEECGKTDDFTKTHPLNSRTSVAIREELGSDHCQLLPHKEFQWLS